MKAVSFEKDKKLLGINQYFQLKFLYLRGDTNLRLSGKPSNTSTQYPILTTLYTKKLFKI
jgi:hypothetical protein